MIDPSTRGAWRDLQGALRPFVERRVRSPSDVDDVLQDIYLRMQRGLGGLRDDELFGPWAYQVARSAVVDHQRRATKHVAMDGDKSVDPPLEIANDTSAEQELASYVALFVAMLPSPYREALTLTELQGVTQKQAAEMLGISVSGMKSRVQRGRAHLRRAFEACCEIVLDARAKVVEYYPRPDGRLPNGMETRHLLPNCCDDRKSDA